MDLQYPHHINLYFTDCNNNGCRIYLQEKNNADYYPQSTRKYSSNYWNKCANNMCPIYLIDKHYYQYFPKKSYF